jgi:hypothetical protein
MKSSECELANWIAETNLNRKVVIYTDVLLNNVLVGLMIVGFDAMNAFNVLRG